jgi:hypothetical protein
MGRNTNCGPTNPRDSSRPQRKCQTKKNSTALVANVIHKIPNPQNNNWMREKKQKEQPPTSLLCKPGITILPKFKLMKLDLKLKTSGP